jgi:hypothetical protein
MHIDSNTTNSNKQINKQLSSFSSSLKQKVAQAESDMTSIHFGMATDSLSNILG